MTGEELDFATVGRFEAAAPSEGAPGRYRYEPFRSGAHYELQQRLRRGERVRCRLGGPQAAIRFVVTGCPEYGVLDVVFEGL